MDRKKSGKQRAYLGALLGAVIFLVIMALYAGFLAWIFLLNPEIHIPTIIVVGVTIVMAATSIGVIAALIQRFKEIRKGEEDDYRIY